MFGLQRACVAATQNVAATTPTARVSRAELGTLAARRIRMRTMKLEKPHMNIASEPGGIGA